jgi:arylsulfatase A-like enzyme
MSPASPPAAPPNVVYVSSHDMGQHVGPYGADVATPALSRLADEGVRFANHFCTAAQCSPSRASALTGKYPHNHGLMGLTNMGWRLNAGERTLPEYLSAAGYRTVLAGLQHVAETPADLGYDAAYTDAVRAREVTDRVLEEVDDLFGAPDPTFLAVGYYESHRPFDADGRYDPTPPGEVDPLPYLPDHPDVREDVGEMEGLIRAADRQLGRLLDGLADAGHLAETLVVFTTDHGVPFPRAKGTCFDPGIESSLLLRLPDRLPAGETVESFAVNVDVLPTVLDLVGLEVPAGLDGRSLLPVVEGEAGAGRDRVFTEMTWHDRYNPMRSVRTERYKYVKNFWELDGVYMPADVFDSKSGAVVCREFLGSWRDEEQLFDLRADPHERENVADDPDYADVLADLREAVATRMRRDHDPLLKGPVDRPVSDEGFDCPVCGDG